MSLLSLVVASFLTISPAAAQQGQPSQPVPDDQTRELRELGAPEPDTAEQTPPRRGDNEAGMVAKVQRFIKEKRIVERLSPENGFYPRFNGLTTGSGFAAGVGYRRHFADDRLFTSVSTILSVKNYKAVDGKARWYRFWDNRVELWSEYRYRDFPEEDFFGTGPSSAESARTSYSFTSHDIVTRGVVNVNPWLRVGAELGYLMPTAGHGADAAIPSVEELFTDAEAPGLGAQPDFVHHGVFVEVDTRDYPGKPTRGGFYHASFHTWDDRPLQEFNFRRFDAEAFRFFPVAGEGHVVALRLGASYVNNAGGDRVPFYFFPYIGGADTIRSFREFRFRDENVLFINTEYRWDAFRHVELAPFFDAGKVAHDWEEMTFADLRTGYGLGIRLHANHRVFFRVDIGAGGGEGANYFFKFGPSF